MCDSDFRRRPGAPWQASQCPQVHNCICLPWERPLPGRTQCTSQACQCASGHKQRRPWTPSFARCTETKFRKNTTKAIVSATLVAKEPSVCIPMVFNLKSANWYVATCEQISSQALPTQEHMHTVCAMSRKSTYLIETRIETMQQLMRTPRGQWRETCRRRGFFGDTPEIAKTSRPCFHKCLLPWAQEECSSCVATQQPA